MVTEKQMRPLVVDWLRSIRLEVAHELFIAGGYCDLIGFRFKDRTSRHIPDLMRVEAVELKVKDYNGVKNQCLSNQYVTNATWAAMPKELLDKRTLKTENEFREAGIGLLAVDVENEDVKVIWYPPHQHRDYPDSFNRKLWRYHLHPQKPKRTPDAGGEAT